MVSWSGDGLVSGYDPTTKRNKLGVFHLATSGVAVDLGSGGGTRLQYDLESTYPSRSSYSSNKLNISASFIFTAGDFSAEPGRDMGMAAHLVKASLFTGTPTPQQIFDAPGLSDRGSAYATAPTTLTANMDFVCSDLEDNTKYWLLVYPAAINNPSNPWTRTNYAPRGSLNTHGRAISIWTNRTPAKPTITSPPTGSVVAPGDTFTLTYNPNDPDELTPNDSLRSNADLAGVEVQFAALPSVDNPNPTWLPLDYWDTDATSTFASVAIGEAGYEKRVKIIRDLGMPVLCGGQTADAVASHGSLPAGDWQIRMRVFDFGHPWPNIINPLGRTTAWKTFDFPSSNTSPWSDAVRVSVPTQVPPPIPLSPKDNVAVQEGSTVQLSWQYRNTFDPPLPQTQRWVQIRKVGDPEWSTIFAGESAASFVDLPAVLDNPAHTPDFEYMTDLGFEAGTDGDWTVHNETEGSVGVSLVNVNDGPTSHSGNRHLRADNDGSEGNWPIFEFTAPIASPDHNAFRLDLWIRPTAESDYGLTSVLAFDDVSGNQIEPVGGETTWIIENRDAPEVGWDWVNITIPELLVPPLAVDVRVNAAGLRGTAPLLVSGTRLDDVSLVGYNTFNTDDFTLEATTHYEWRVRVRDSDGVLSNYSEPARFWVVPALASGEVVPVPDNTIDGATLGCGTNRVFVYRRGGLERVGEIRGFTHVDWGRVRDDISTSKVIIEDWDIDCGNLLARLQTWAYELVIFRDNGFTIDRVWEGPITLLTYEDDRVVIQAKDVMGYAYRRIIKQRMSDSGSGATVVSRARQVLQNVFAPDDPNVLAYMQVLAREDDAMQYRSTPAYSRTAFEEVDDMAANSGLDYTAVGRAILIWGTKHRIGTLPEFRDENLGSSPIVSEYGMSMANVYSVSDGAGVYGEANRLNEEGDDPIYGLVEMLSSTWASETTEDTGTYTQEGLETVRESFEEFSERSIADRYPPPVVVRVPDNTTIHPDTVISIQQLVPGVVIPLRSNRTLRAVSGNQKLDSVRVVEEGGRETISITLSPFSRDDAAPAEGAEE